MTHNYLAQSHQRQVTRITLFKVFDRYDVLERAVCLIQIFSDKGLIVLNYLNGTCLSRLHYKMSCSASRYIHPKLYLKHVLMRGFQR